MVPGTATAPRRTSKVSTATFTVLFFSHSWFDVTSTFPLNMFGRRAFMVAGPTSWNSSPDRLRSNTRVLTVLLKTELFASY